MTRNWACMCIYREYVTLHDSFEVGVKRGFKIFKFTPESNALCVYYNIGI